jgi:hypothetical protein
MRCKMFTSPLFNSIVAEVKTPQQLGRNPAFCPSNHQEQVHIDTCEPVKETLSNAAIVGDQKRVGIMAPVLQQAFTQVAPHVRPCTVFTDGIDFLILKCGRKASQSGQLEKGSNQDSTL